MRIAQIAPLTESVPPKLYGGTERVVSYITEALVELGHEVTLFASGDSVTSAKLEAVWPRALRLDPGIRDRIAPHMLLMELVRRQADAFDVLHFHMDYYSFSVFKRQETPFVTTLHGRLDLPEQQPVFDTFNTAPVISISNSQRQPLPQARWLTTVYHGLPEQLYTPQPVEQKYLAFLGRISPKSASTRPSASPASAVCQSGSRLKSMRPIASTSSGISVRCLTCRTSNSSGRSRTTGRPSFSQALMRCCFRLTGRSPSVL